MPQGVPRCGHAAVCTWGILGKQQLLPAFPIGKSRTPFCRRSIYPGEGFSPKDIHLWACRHFIKQICWHIDRKAQPRPWCHSAYWTLAKHLQHSGMGIGHECSSWCHMYLPEEGWILCLWGGPSLNSTFLTLLSSVAVVAFTSFAYTHLSFSAIALFLSSYFFSLKH